MFPILCLIAVTLAAEPTGTPLRSILVHERWISAVAISRDGKHIAFACGEELKFGEVR